jgi:LysR family pca operon transcriptional activator
LKRHLQQRLKFRHLRVVDAILTQGSLLQAAKALGLSQPALTKSLHEIEEITGARLFDRHVRGVTPNAYGLAVGETARRLLLEAARLEDALDALDGGDGGPVVVGALPVAAAGLLPGALARFQAAHPGVEVQVHQERSDALLSALAVREIDFVVGRLYAPQQPDTFVRRPIYDEGIAILARSDHPIFGAEPIALESLDAYPLVLPTVSQLVGRDVDEFLAGLGVAPRQPLRSSSPSLIRESLFATDGIAVLPKVMLAGDLMRGAVRALPIAAKAPPRPAGLILRGDAPPPTNAAAFIKLFIAYAEEVQRTLEGEDAD